MKVRSVIATALMLTVSDVAHAGREFAQYDGRDAIQEGLGGTKIVRDGVDFWTTGSPPRRFRVLGLLTDTRKDKLLSGKAIGSSSLAKQVRDAGGDALIVLDQNSQYSGSTALASIYNFGSYGNAFVSGRDVHKIITRFVVVKYMATDQ